MLVFKKRKRKKKKRLSYFGFQVKTCVCFLRVLKFLFLSCSQVKRELHSFTALLLQTWSIQVVHLGKKTIPTLALLFDKIICSLSIAHFWIALIHQRAIFPHLHWEGGVCKCKNKWKRHRDSSEPLQITRVFVP